MKTSEAVLTSPLSRIALVALAAQALVGCVPMGKYNNMLAQQQAIESALSKEISANQVEIQQLQNGIRVRMASDLLYGEGSIELTEAGRHALDKVAPTLSSSAGQGYQIDIIGNTDNIPIGPELISRYPTNWELAGARSSVVVRYLQQRGVTPGMLEAVSNGEYHPVASNDTAGGRAKNRRTDVEMRPTAAVQSQ